MSRSQGLFGSPVLMGNVLPQEGGGKVVEEGSWHIKNSCGEPSRELGAQQALPLLSLQPPYEKGITIPIVPIRSVKVRVIRSRSQSWWVKELPSPLLGVLAQVSQSLTESGLQTVPGGRSQHKAVSSSVRMPALRGIPFALLCTSAPGLCLSAANSHPSLSLEKTI